MVLGRSTHEQYQSSSSAPDPIRADARLRCEAATRSWYQAAGPAVPGGRRVRWRGAREARGRPARGPGHDERGVPRRARPVRVSGTLGQVPTVRPGRPPVHAGGWAALRGDRPSVSCGDPVGGPARAPGSRTPWPRAKPARPSRTSIRAKPGLPGACGSGAKVSVGGAVTDGDEVTASTTRHVDVRVVAVGVGLVTVDGGHVHQRLGEVGGAVLGLGLVGERACSR